MTLAVLFSALTALSGFAATAKIGCDENDVRLAQKYRDAIEGLVEKKTLQPIELSQAEVKLAETKRCAGQLSQDKFCDAVISHLANLKTIVEKLEQTLPEDIGGVEWYLDKKLYYAKFCINR